MRKYFVKYFHNSIEPEEIFLEPGASGRKEALERLEFSVSPRATRFLVFLGFGMLLLSLSFSFYWQVVKGSTYARKAEENRLRLLFSEAPRGLIVDRYGKVLAENRMIFDMAAVPLELPKDEAGLGREAKVIGESLLLEPGPILARLEEIRKENLADPQLLFPDISRDSALSLKTRENELQGIKVNGRFQRFYPWGSAFSHLLGYTGKVSAKEVKEDPELTLKDVIGRAGLEAFYEKLLRGKKGELRYEINARLQVTEKEETQIAPIPGKALKLTIDAEFQKYLYDLMSAFIGTRLGGGVAIALDPQTGETLALVSVPGFDNNLFAKGISQADFDRLIRSSQKPLFNRAISGEYSSGSTIKPFLAAAALEEKIIDPRKKIPDVEGKLVVPNPYDPSKPTTFKDWKIHGFVDMTEAIAQSCNIYFYTIGGGFKGKIGDYSVDQKGLGIERIKRYLSEFGWGAPLGIDLPGESSGLLPDPDWKAKNRKKDPIWRIGDTYLTSIGQGDILATPLQLTASMAIFANDGKLLKPFLVKSVSDPEGNGVIEERTPQLIRAFSFAPEELAVVREGLRRTVVAGSASWRLADLPFEAAGKTGTAQVTESLENTNAIFVSYMPYKDPKLILSILVEGGGGGAATAVPIAKEALLWYWQNRILSTPQL